MPVRLVRLRHASGEQPGDDQHARGEREVDRCRCGQAEAAEQGSRRIVLGDAAEHRATALVEKLGEIEHRVDQRNVIRPPGEKDEARDAQPTRDRDRPDADPARSSANQQHQR